MTSTKIKKLRELLGESQEAFAERVGVRRATITDWENGKKKPSPMAIILLTMIAEKISKDKKPSS